MATSGTIGGTVVQTDRLLEHAILRCKIPGPKITPKTVQLAEENLFFLLLNLSNRGLNLWCVDQQIIGLFPGKKTYVLPVGTIDVLNVMYSQPTVQASTLVNGTTSSTATLSTAATIVRYGFMPTTSFTGVLTLTTDGGVAQQVLASQTWVAGTWYWFDLNPTVSSVAWVLTTSAVSMTLSQFVLSSQSYDQKVSPMNRDEYTQQPNKNQSGVPSTSFWFEKLVNPQINLWPVTTNGFDQLSLWRHRQIQDVGTLTQQIELPNRWLDPIIWQLAGRLAFECEDVDPARRAEVMAAADKYLVDGELNEADHMPLFFTPQIRGYTR